MNPRGFLCESEKCWSHGHGPEISVSGSPEDGASCGIGSVQWRHHVMMRVTTLVDQESKKFHMLNLAALA